MSAPYNPGYGQPPIYRVPQVNFGWIGESWEIYRKAWTPWLILSLLPVVFHIALMIRSYTTPQMLGLFSLFRSGNFANQPATPTQSISDALFNYLFIFIEYVFYYLFACCASDVAVRQVRGEVVAVNSILNGLRNWLQMLVFCILWGISFFAGVIACCVGIPVAYGFLMPGFALVADGETATNAFSRSIGGMQHDWLDAALFAFVCSLMISFGGLFTCYLGYFVFYPMMFIVSALAYRDMIGMPGVAGMSGFLPAPAPWQQYGQAGFSPQDPGVWPPAPSAGQPPFGQPPVGQSPYGQPPAPNQPPFSQAPPNQSPFGQPPSNQPPTNPSNGRDQDSNPGQ